MGLYRSIRILLVAMALHGGHAQAQSLREVFLAALNADPALASSEAQYRATAERVKQARAEMLPTVGVTGSASSSTFTPDNGAESRDFHSRRWALQVSQPLYKPAVATALEAANATLASAQAQLEAAEFDLASRVSTAYFEALAAREVLLAAQREQKSTMQQLAVARRSFEIGTVAITDVRDAEAKYALDTARSYAAENDLEFKREALRQMLGGMDFELTVLPRSAPSPEAAGEDLGLLLKEAEARNPVVRQALLQWKAAELEARKLRRGHAPTLDLSASYGSDDSTGTPSNPVKVQGATAQAGLNLTIPLFAGFGTEAKVQEALALRDRARSEVDAAGNTTASKLREAYFGLKSALRQEASLKLAEQSTDLAVQANRKGYRIGTSTMADVLKAESQFFQAQRDLMQAKLDAHRNRLQLQIALGRPWRESVDQLSNLLVPAELAMAEPGPAPVDAAPAGAPRVAARQRPSARAATPPRPMQPLKLSDRITTPGS